jgi:1-piperideine-2-carboxylate/1-pyrroline-2-carboxylate reductase [NAD(P)H]
MAQGHAHLEAFATGLGVREAVVVSRSSASAQALAARGRELGLRVEVATDPDAALAACPLVVTCTPANGVVLNGPCRPDAFIAAVGAFTPRMVELSPALCRWIAETGTVVVDTADAVHEAGDLLQAGLDVSSFATLRDVVPGHAGPRPGPVLFKSCGWAGWDLAAARCAMGQAE